MKQSPWLWIPSLFGAEEIPAAIITYVALLMFLQTDTPPAVATAYCGCLFIPWILKSFLRERVRRYGHFRSQIQWLELSMVLALVAVAFTFPRYTIYGEWLFASLFLVSLLTAWHELAARMYYERMLYPEMQREWQRPKMFFAQLGLVFTYGLMIMLVGALQVINRDIALSWNEGCYFVAGIFMLLALYHIFVLKRPNVGDAHHPGTTIEAVKAEVLVIDRIRQKPYWLHAVLGLGLLLLPQSLMFFSRVLFLMAPRAEGGLGCTIQEVGFAQGTIGVIAFSIGIALARHLTSMIPLHRVFWWMAIPLGLSPLMYLVMTLEAPTSLNVLCIATFQAQFLFGFGLPVCMHFVRYISGERYRNSIYYLYVPLVAAVMLIPMSLSGWLVQLMGYRMFFLFDVLMAPVAWAYVYYAHINQKLTLEK